MYQSPTIEDTISFIKTAHNRQFDQAGKDYYLHPIAVMNRLPGEAPLSWKLAALLHDVLEDTPYTRADLAARGYDADTLDIVALLTLDPASTLTYPQKIEVLIASGNRGAIAVKYCDMSENGDETRLAMLPPERAAYFRARYAAPLAALKTALTFSATETSG